MIKIRCGAGLGAAFLLASAAAAQSPQGDITRAQAEQNVRSQLGRLDADHDGIITDKEIEKVIDMIATGGGPAQIGDRLHQLMAEFGHNGRMAIDDVVKARLAQFDAADTNHDGKLDAAEREAAMAARVAPAGATKK